MVDDSPLTAPIGAIELLPGGTTFEEDPVPPAKVPAEERPARTTPTEETPPPTTTPTEETPPPKTTPTEETPPPTTTPTEETPPPTTTPTEETPPPVTTPTEETPPPTTTPTEETPPPTTTPTEETPPPVTTPTEETPPPTTTPTEETPPPTTTPTEETPPPTTTPTEETPPPTTTPTEETPPPVTTPTEETPPPKTPAEPPTLTAVQGEDFAGQPSDVLLTYTVAVHPSDVPQCVGLSSSDASAAFGGIDQGPAPQTIRLELAPGGMMPTQIQCSAGNATDEAGTPSLATSAMTVASAGPSSGGVLGDPIDSKYLSEVPFGDRSFWVQPWRSYLDTWPASRLLDSLGINFNVSQNQAEDTAHLLQDDDFKLARIEIGWNSISYEHPTKFANETYIHTMLSAMHNHGLRPLILLNANSGGPGPAKNVTLETTAEAPAGARTVTLTPASAAQVVPGKTGFNHLSFAGDPDVLITSVGAGGVATLSKPLPAALAAGAHAGATLLYAPFGPPELSTGEPNPAFQATLAGWLSYVATICKEAQSIFGPEGYDLEVWNELTFGSQFLNENNYYSPARETGKGSVTNALLNDTVAYVRNPANGISPGVGLTDGFANETPFTSPAALPTGLTAMSKHLYQSGEYYPNDEEDNAIQPLNALGEKSYTTSGTSSAPVFTPLFKPTFTAQLPEYYLTATQTETIVRDLSPVTNTIYGGPHGRNVAAEGGSPLQVWMTEYNISTGSFIAESVGHPGDGTSDLNAAQSTHVQTEILLRSLVSMINKGMAREYFYAATGREWNLVSESFTSAVNADPSVYPGDQLGGETMESFQRMLKQFQGPGPEGPARQLSLLSIAQEGNHAQITGNGTAAYPNLYDREMLAVLPFQSSPTRFVIPVYVMTENLTTANKPSEPENATDRFDLPNENFRITLGNLPETTNPPTVSAYDPIHNETTPARFVSRKGNQAIFEIAATDYPRLLSIDYTGK